RISELKAPPEERVATEIESAEAWGARLVALVRARFIRRCWRNSLPSRTDGPSRARILSLTDPHRGPLSPVGRPRLRCRPRARARRLDQHHLYYSPPSVAYDSLRLVKKALS